MYIFGGEGARGFCYVMMLGSFFGCYSSVAIASPLLLGWKGAFGADTTTVVGNADEKNNSVKTAVAEPAGRGA
jgi:preprotein translocase subunit SecF